MTTVTDTRPWTDLPLLGVDLETTGLELPGARIVTAALVSVDLNASDGPASQGYLTDPGIPIPDEASSIHGITTAYAREHGCDYQQVYNYVRSALEEQWRDGGAVCAYNAAFDLSVIHHEGLRLGYPPLDAGVVIDPMVIDRQLQRAAGTDRSRKLNTASKVHRVRHDVEHDAIEDVLATLRIVWRLRAHPVARWSADTLMRRQAQWYRQRGEELREYYGAHPEKGRDPLTISIEWPVAR